MSRNRNDFEACERCGAFLLKEFVQWHQCKGSNLSLRPANIPVAKWLELQRGNDLIGAMFASGADLYTKVNVEKTVTRTKEDVTDRVTEERLKKVADLQAPIKKRNLWLEVIVASVLVVITFAAVLKVIVLFLSQGG